MNKSNQKDINNSTNEDRWDEILEGGDWVDDLLQEDGDSSSVEAISQNKASTAIKEEVAAEDKVSEAENKDETSAEGGGQVANQEEIAQEIASSDTQDWLDDSRVDLPGQLTLDVYETRDHLIVLCRIAGVEEDDIDVSIGADNILSIRGKLSAPIDEVVENHHIQECYWGEFSRSIALSVDVKKDNEDIKATLEKGILKIVFVKIRQDVIRKINIQKA